MGVSSDAYSRLDCQFCVELDPLRYIYNHSRCTLQTAGMTVPQCSALVPEDPKQFSGNVATTIL